ncbi:hypothetical protein LOTGIDRAFT_168175 [Lottia gigantea]|uniref:Fe2OG dioxygenase domain-containing protein n=1 Tax=Lottia gigantea TaxID=225164 RepID=V3Z2U3_LOTGI|nr:hypothetical protein LOTGIDRAFT_168175 [Lottia gigantea]ESO84918.1 hypothetical protein LOTGIDRAFT_168175 [Lottia gigantea]
MATSIPVVDFQKYGLHKKNETEITNADLKKIGDKLIAAFDSIGFCYVINHGIPQDLISQIFGVSNTFFDLPTETKMKYVRPKDSDMDHGYVKMEAESLNPERPGDNKEAFDFAPSHQKFWPNKEVPEMKDIFQKFYDECKQMAFRIFDAFTSGLNLEDRNFLRNSHKNIGRDGNCTIIRTNWYPPLPKDGSIKPGQERCGEHSDYGSMTLLFQDGIGGLEVCNKNGDYIPATPVPGAICVNIGDLMQRWTADKLKATKHRVLIPESEVLKNKGRQSIAFFIHPDVDRVITCLDGSDKYKPILASDYLKLRFSLTYL